MRFHLPRPLHGWRAFLGEIGVVVLGVLIALTAGQAVDWLHWQDEAQETRLALHQELARAVGSFQYRLARQDCADRRLDEITRWLDSSQPGDRLPLARRIGMPTGYAFLSGAWETAKSGQAAWRMPLEERLAYAHLYGALESFNQTYLADIAVWQQMAGFSAAEPLDHADRMRLRSLVMQASLGATKMPSYAPFIMPDVRELAITPEKRPLMYPELVQSFCSSLLVRPKA